MSASKLHHVPLSSEQVVADALNEQGFLFAKLIRENIQFGVSGKGKCENWRCVATEYPVTASDGTQTRIDLVLRHASSDGLHLCIECKRANPLYKQWVFFDKEYAQNETTKLCFEVFRNPDRPAVSGNQSSGIRHFPQPPGCATFNLYLEAAINREKRAGHTETIEDALLQVIKGQSGLIARQVNFTGPFAVVALPVVVTTAQLLEARFDINRVSLSSGRIEPSDVKADPIEFCAVNYHPNDELSVESRAARGVYGNIEEDMLHWQTRTVFVVHSESIIRFLGWLHSHFSNFV